jgi:hypothetical protein
MKPLFESKNPHIKYLCHYCNRKVGQMYGEPIKGREGVYFIYKCELCTYGEEERKKSKR